MQYPSNGTYHDATFMRSNEKSFLYNDLKNQTLRVVFPTIEPPYVNYANFSDDAVAEKGYGPGVVMEILKEIGRRLNLTYEIIPSEGTSWGEFINGTWTGAFGQLKRGEADILAGAAIIDYDRSMLCDMTYPFQFEPTGIMIRYPEKYEDDTLLIVTEPFSWTVWFITAVVIFVSALIFLAMTTILRRVFGEMHVTLFESTWVFFSIFVQQGLPQQPRSWSCRVLIGLWWLASITLSATFTGSLVALFAVEKTNLPFQNIDTLVRSVKQGKFEIVMDGNSFTRTEMIARSKLPVYQELWHEILVNHKVKYVDGIQKGVEFVRANSGYALLGPMATLRFYVYSDCKVLLLNDGILPVYLSIPLAKNSKYTSYFSTKIREMVERGFTEKWISDYESYVATQRINECNSTTPGPKSYLDLKRAQGAFWVLLAGTILGIVLFIGEFLHQLFYKHIFKRYWRSNNESSTTPPSIHNITTPECSSSEASNETEGKMIARYLILFGLFITISYSFRTQSTGVKGKLMCGNKPANGVQLTLYDEDNGPDPDDDLGRGYTNADGAFELNGNTTELTTIDPHLKIYHDCNDGAQPCQRRWKFELPNRYILSGKNNQRTLDIGTWNLEAILPGESRDCHH
ncbi:unnamed protein product [Caenorhabditis bovis]|uniref:Ionotropic glutamate receptor L-glutamate and glycine-binding domain-containing protein n=1 Tax=Caenorhabditis bovis TaxID=2654633 RepID=A0A8S1EC86_9PELO|nr:unnamed protein product [Caenorhabditis bovis]